MTDDAELRARIEAQVAARRAGGSAPKADKPVDEAAEDEPRTPSETRASGLRPTRPWSRSDTAPPPPADDLPGPRGGGPLRPWVRRKSDAAETPAVPPPAPPRPTPATGLTPARPWQGEPEAADGAPTTTPAPAVPGSPIGRRRRVGRRGDDEEAASMLGEAGGGGLDDHARRRRRGRRPVEGDADGAKPRHAARPPAIPSERPTGAEPASDPRPSTPEVDEQYETFALPEPDASFEKSWLRTAAPIPTRDWTPPPTAEPTPVVLTKSERPTRPTPGDGARAIPSDEPEPPSPAPPPAPSVLAPPSPPERPRPSAGISGANGWGTTSGPGRAHGPDISKFLAAGEPDPVGDHGGGDHGGDHGGDDTTGDDRARGRVTGRLRRGLVRTFVIVLIATIAAVLLRAFVVQPYYIPSESMEPTLHGCAGCNDDRVLVDKLSYRAHDIRAGDIVVFHRPPNAPDITDRVLIKRVVGRPGDVVELKNGRVYVNGLLLEETYVNPACGRNPTKPLNGTSKWRVPADDIFVMGDNRCRSEDSRAFGPIVSSSVIGRAFAIVWPVGRIGLL